MNNNFNLDHAKSIIAEASGVPVNTTFEQHHQAD